MFKYPPAIYDDKKVLIGIHVPARHRVILAEIGNGSISIGVQALLHTFEKKISKFLKEKKELIEGSNRAKKRTKTPKKKAVKSTKIVVKTKRKRKPVIVAEGVSVE